MTIIDYRKLIKEFKFCIDTFMKSLGSHLKDLYAIE